MKEKKRIDFPFDILWNIEKIYDKIVYAVSDGPILIGKILNQLFCPHGRDVWEFSFTFSIDVLRKLTKSSFLRFKFFFCRGRSSAKNVKLMEVLCFT